MFFGTCFLLHAVLRCAVSETAGIDDVDQILRAQVWSWGYGPQPPLYTWLTKIFLGTFGYNVFSMLLLKEVIVFSIYFLVYVTARQLTDSHVCAMVATALLQANFSIAWEAHRELTHTVLVSAFSVGTIYAFLRLNAQNWSRYLQFGLCCGFGMLAKYNYIIVWLALMLAAMSVHEVRPLVFNCRMLFALVLMLAICSPHYAWVASHRELAFSSVPKLHVVAAGNWRLVLVALGKWVEALLAHAGPILVLMAILIAGLPQLPNRTPFQTLLWRTLLCIFLLVTVNIVCFRVTGIRDRYVQPFCVWLPALLVTLIPKQVSRFRLNLLLLVSGLATVGIVIAAPGRVLLTESLKKNEVLNTPFRRLALDLNEPASAVDCIIGENHPLAGNLRLWFPRTLVLDPEVGPLFTSTPRRCLVVWDADRNAAAPPELLRFVKAVARADIIQILEPQQELLKYHHARKIRLGTALVSSANRYRAASNAGANFLLKPGRQGKNRRGRISVRWKAFAWRPFCAKRFTG